MGLRYGSSKLCQVLLVVALATAVTSRQYKVHDEEDSSDNKEYPSEYYADEPQASDHGDAKASAGFVEPIDFSSLFVAGFGGSPAGSSKIDNFFQPRSATNGGFGSGIGGSVFPAELQASATNSNNGTGFISPSVRFQSLFDSDTAQTVGFRAQDFLKRTARSEDDAISAGTSPIDFFSSTFAHADDDFTTGSGLGSDFDEGDSTEFKPQVKPSKSFEPSGYSSGKLASAGKSSYPAPTAYPYRPTQSGSSPSSYRPTPPSSSPSSYQYGSNPSNRPITTYHPSNSGQYQAKPSSALPYDAYPSKSASSYNPTGPYVSKPGYKAPTSEKLLHRAYSSPSYDSKSIYPKKASEFYPSRVGQRPTGASFRPSAAQTQDAPRYHYGGPSQHDDKSSYVDPEDYYKFGPSSKEYESAESKSDYLPYISHASGNQDKNLPPTSDPYGPREFGRDAETHSPPTPAESKIENQVNPADDKKNCRRVDKHLTQDSFVTGRFRRDAMTCYVCTDPKTGGKVEKCSYDSTPSADNNNNYFHGHVTSFSDDHPKVLKSLALRRKRDLSSFDSSFSDADYDSLYTFSEPRTRIARQEPKSYGKKYGTSYEDYIDKFIGPSEKNYQYQPEHYTPQKFSLVDEAEYKASPTQNADQECKTITKGTMTCSTCHNPKTGGNSEQCSYATNPKDNNYFIARQSSFNSKNPHKQSASNQRSSREEPSTGNYGTNDGPTQKYSSKTTVAPYDYSTEVAAGVSTKGSYKGPLEVSPYQYGNRRSDDDANNEKYTDEKISASQQYNRNRNNDDSTTKQYNNYGRSDGPTTQRYNRESDETPTTRQYGYGGGGGDGHKSSYDYSTPAGDGSQHADRRSDESKQQPQSYFESKSYDDYFKELFPELAGSETKNAKRSDNVEDYLKDATQQARYTQKPADAGTVDPVAYYKSVPDYYTNPEPKKDLERVLGEFSQKDRSACKKVIRDKMTCYQCTDKKGMQHEECMFVAASEPKSQHLAYHEVKEFRLVPDNTSSPSSSSSSTNTTRALDNESAPSVDTKNTATKMTPPPTLGTTTTISKPKTTDKTKTRRISLKPPTTMTTTTTTTTTARPIRSTTTVKSADKPLRRTSRFAIKTSRTVETPSTNSPRLSSRRPMADATASASEREETRSRPERDDRGEQKPQEEDEPEIFPKDGQFRVDRDGYYTAETKHVFDPVQKVYLPEYMLSRSEHEEIFDAVMKSGR